LGGIRKGERKDVYGERGGRHLPINYKALKSRDTGGGKGIGKKAFS